MSENKLDVDMSLVANFVPSTFFRHKEKANFFIKIPLGTMLFSCRINICSVNTFLKLSEATTNLFLKISQISPKIPVLESLFNKAGGQQLYLKETPTQCFPVKFAIFLRTPILKDICERLPLNFKDKFYVKFNF